MVFDIIIVGAGIVGLALALDLGQAGFKVALIEKQAPYYLNTPLDLKEYDTRVFAINWASQQFFNTLKAWDAMQGARVSPYQAMQVWDASSSGAIEFGSESIMESELGHIIEQKVIAKALWEQIDKLNNIEVIVPCELLDLTLSPSLSTVYTNQTSPYDTLQAHLIVGADGAKSWVRTQADLGVSGWSYEQSALVATIHTEKSHQKTAWQRFDFDGPLALLPLAQPHYCSIVWMTDPMQAQSLKTIESKEFSEILTHRFGSSLGALTLAQDNRAVFPLTMQHAKAYVRPGCVLIGDAAHVIHPLAGLGINLGLKNAKTLSNLVKIQKSKHRALGDLAYLKRYERQEKNQARLMIAAMEAFKRGFGTQNGLIKYLRNMGLNLVNERNMLKTWFIELAMGK